ncbi:MAG: hypothetical protein D6729_07965 [Deltaproteobacteria bacterium]|nr:MAG: hypothetical protein D6729_07965 [Deltaproteobacteria bacterium]
MPHLFRVYPGEVHAFHALVWRRNARLAWRETFAFLEEALGRSAVPAATDPADSAGPTAGRAGGASGAAS